MLKLSQERIESDHNERKGSRKPAGPNIFFRVMHKLIKKEKKKGRPCRERWVGAKRQETAHRVGENWGKPSRVAAGGETGSREGMNCGANRLGINQGGRFHEALHSWGGLLEKKKMGVGGKKKGKLGGGGQWQRARG